MKYEDKHKEMDAYREWNKIPEGKRRMHLNNALCMNCGVAAFSPGYKLRKDGFGIVIEGVCSKCGQKMMSCCY